MPKHRRSEIEPSRASLRSRANIAEAWPEAVAYDQAPATDRPTAGRPGVGPARNGYRASTGYDSTGHDSTGHDSTADEPGWELAREGHSWQEWEDWQDWGPPPALHPDHPSAPVPRVQLPADHPSRPMPAARLPGRPEPPRWRPDEPARTWGAPPQAPDGYHNGSRWLYAVPDDAAFLDHGNRSHQSSGQPPAGLAEPYWRETAGFQDPVLHEADRFQQQPGARWQETTDYRREGDPYGPDRGPATGRFQNSHPRGADSLRTAGQVLTLAEGRAAQIAQQAHDYAVAIREAAEREAAAITQQATGQAATISEAAERQAAEIREAAEREAAELRARLDSMSGELGRVAALVTERLAAPAMPAIAPALPGATPAPPSTSPALPDATPTRRDITPRPATTPTKPASGPASRPAGPAKPSAGPTKKPQKPGRQLQAMRIAQYSTAALVSFALVFGAAEIGIHGLKFFVFREQGQGQSTEGPTDQQFLARQSAATHHVVAPKGRHHRESGHLEVHH